MNELQQEIKELIIESLDLEDIAADDIDSEGMLFGEGLGLDSIDALELGLAIHKKYKVKLDANSEETKKIFESVANLAAFVEANRA